jgi:hypothetical protein
VSDFLIFMAGVVTGILIQIIFDDPAPSADKDAKGE